MQFTSKLIGNFKYWANCKIPLQFCTPKSKEKLTTEYGGKVDFFSMGHFTSTSVASHNSESNITAQNKHTAQNIFFELLKLDKLQNLGKKLSLAKR